MEFRVNILKFLAYASLLIERVSLAIWRLGCWIALFAALWLFEVPLALGSALGVALSLVFLFGAFFFIRRDFKGFDWPSAREVERRIERDSDAKHRPLSGMDDRPVVPEDGLLWQREQIRRQSALSRLKVSAPRAFVAKHDPRGIRLLVVLGLICGLFIAGGDWKNRLLSGVVPFEFAQNDGASENPITFWITPPDYTNIERIVPQLGQEDALSIPQGSMIKLIVPDQFGRALYKPRLYIDETRHVLARGEDGHYVLDMEVIAGQRIEIATRPFSRMGWDYDLIPDTVPAIAVADDPKTLPNGQMQFAVDVKDDYGVENLNMRMMLDASVKDAPLGWPYEETRLIMSPAQEYFQIVPSYDLASHPWAGLPVVFTFSAHDHLDQIAQSAPIKAVLPQRRFTRPAAREIVMVRKGLIVTPDNFYREHAMALGAILYAPQLYNYDMRVFLPLRAAIARLVYNAPSTDTAYDMMGLLWDIALRIEDGNLSLAARDLKAIQKELEQALQDPNISDAEIAQLMEQLRQATAAYMQAMMQEMQKNMVQNGQMPELSPDSFANMMNMNDLADMLDQMQADAMAGDRDAAREMLSKLQRMSEMAQNAAQGAAGEMPKDMQQMMESMKAMQSLIDQQKALRVDTIEQAEMQKMLRGLDVPMDKQDAPFLKLSEFEAIQEGLRTDLVTLMLESDEALGEIPENMGFAEQAMKRAAEALGGQNAIQSVTEQDEAIAQLEKAQQETAQKLSKRMQQMTGLAMGSGMPQNLDPLGRPMGEEDDGGEGTGSKVKVPNEARKQWVQKILDELRQRSGERSRPPEELDYYRRLLKRF